MKAQPSSQMALNDENQILPVHTKKNIKTPNGSFCSEVYLQLSYIWGQVQKRKGTKSETVWDEGTVKYTVSLIPSLTEKKWRSRFTK